MSPESQNEVDPLDELKNVLKSLNYMIRSTYQSYYYLKNLTKYTPSTKLSKFYYPYLNLYNHLVRQFKINICLNIWKMYFESDNQSIRIDKLSSILRDEKQIIIHQTRTCYKKYKIQINKLRQQSIAHNDLKKDDYSITLSEMFDILNEINSNFNKMLNEIKNNYNELANEFFIYCSPITEKELEKIENESKVAIDMIFSGNIKESLDLNSK